VIRIAGILAVLTLVGVSAFNAIAGTRSHQVSTGTRALGHGMFLSVDESHIERAGQTDGLIEAQVTLSNRDANPFNTDHLTFSLSDAAGDRSLALLPSELYGHVASPHLLREGVLVSGQTLSAVLYFRSLSPQPRSLDVRVDLANADGQVASRSLIPLALK
jgi:hypothetical protein